MFSQQVGGGEGVRVLVCNPQAQLRSVGGKAT